MAMNEVTDEGLWSWWVVHIRFRRHGYRKVEAGEPWPDLASKEAEPELDPNRALIGRNHNQPPEEGLSVQHSTGNDAAIAWRTH